MELAKCFNFCWSDRPLKKPSATVWSSDAGPCLTACGLRRSVHDNDTGCSLICTCVPAHRATVQCIQDTCLILRTAQLFTIAPSSGRSEQKKQDTSTLLRASEDINLLNDRIRLRRRRNGSGIDAICRFDNVIPFRLRAHHAVPNATHQRPPPPLADACRART